MLVFFLIQLLCKSFGRFLSFWVIVKTDENQRMSRLRDDRQQMNSYNRRCSEKKAKIKRWISKRDTSIKNIHPVPCTVAVSLPAQAMWSCLTRRQKDMGRQVEKQGRNEKREGKVVVAIPCQGLEKAWPVQRCTSIQSIKQNARQEKEGVQ